MTNRIAKCGCDCFNCPTFKENIRTSENRKKCSAAWDNYLGITLSPEKLRPCDGCSIPDSERKTFYLNCKVRKCAMINSIENCAFCTGFPCEELLKAHSIQKINNRQEFTEKTGKEISENDYRLFIEPYTGLNHLTKIRQTLTVRDLKDFKKYSLTIKFTHIDNLSDKPRSLQIIYSLLTTICVEQNISYARLNTIKNNND